MEMYIHGQRTKLVPVWLVGGRGEDWAHAFMYDLASRLSYRIQLTSDAHRPYYQAVYDVFREDIDYAQQIKYFEADRIDFKRQSALRIVKTKTKTLIGNPDTRHISTSLVERQNLTMRMSMRRFTRLTNGFSKKVENLHYAVALHFMYYNFCRIHSTLKTTPAVKAGISDHIWKIGDIVELLENRERSN